jgi:hypothetical protein
MIKLKLVDLNKDDIQDSIILFSKEHSDELEIKIIDKNKILFSAYVDQCGATFEEDLDKFILSLEELRGRVK